MTTQGVLIVEDDQDIREVTAEVLRDAGYTVYEAPDGKPALERLRTHREGLVVLLDLMMPGLDGLSMLQAVARESPAMTKHAYILFTATNKYHSRQIAESFERLNVAFLPKPFELDALLAVVQAAASKIA